MLTYPQLKLPEAWKPLFRALAMEGWDYQESMPETPEWASRPVLRFENRLEPWLGERYLIFVDEPEWCGNALQVRGFSIAMACVTVPDTRGEAEQVALPLMGDWEWELEGFVEKVGLIEAVSKG
jgi:hypothetical protein